MSISDQRTNLRLVTVGDFDPQADQGIEYDFIGRVIAGRYRVQEHIGGGGMADVFRANDEDLGIDVAIKLLKPRIASDELRARMVLEAQAAAQVRHPNLLRVFGTGKLDGTAYIVMELLGGPSLEQYLRERAGQRLPWRDALELLLPALEALHAIHERGYIHRDIKASNILITEGPGRPSTAFVIDLGLVKADRALRTADGPPTTEVGRLLCTPSYASPEQAAGLPLDRRSDVYSMAVTLYRVLAGRLPFHEARGKAPMVVLTKHIYNEPTMLAAAAADADIPSAVAEVVESALRKNPNDRPQSMRAFADALRAAATSAGPAVARIGASPRGRPHELLLGLGLGVVVTLLATRYTSSLPSASSNPATTGGRYASPDTAAPAPPRSSAAPPDPAVAPVPMGAPATTSVVGATSTPVDRSPADPSLAQPVSGPAASTVTSPGERRPGMRAEWRRALARQAPAVQRCADQASGSRERLAVAVNIDNAGRVIAHVKGAPDSPLSRCLNAAFKDTTLPPPGERTSFIHVFHLQLRADP